MRPSRDHHLPPDPDAYRHAPHPKGRIIVIAPTRAACETIELALGLRLETLLEREHGDEIRALAGSGTGTAPGRSWCGSAMVATTTTATTIATGIGTTITGITTTGTTDLSARLPGA